MENNQEPEQTNENVEETIFSPEEFSMQGYDKHIRQARNVIFIAAGVLVLNLVILIASAPAFYEFLWIDILIWGVFIAGFVALGFWTKKKPYSAIIGAMILYGVFIILNAALDVTTLYKGILIKVIIVVFLFKGLNDAREAQQIKEQIGK